VHLYLRSNIVIDIATTIICVGILLPSPGHALSPTRQEQCCMAILNGTPEEQAQACGDERPDAALCNDVVANGNQYLQRHGEGMPVMARSAQDRSLAPWAAALGAAALLAGLVLVLRRRSGRTVAGPLRSDQNPPAAADGPSRGTIAAAIICSAVLFFMQFAAAAFNLAVLPHGMRPGFRESLAPLFFGMLDLGWLGALVIQALLGRWLGKRRDVASARISGVVFKVLAALSALSFLLIVPSRI